MSDPVVALELMRLQSLSPDEAVTPMSPFLLPIDYMHFQELLHRVAGKLQIPLEDIQDLQHKLLGIL